MQSDRQLIRWYNAYNKKYFNGELPASVTVIWEPIPACHGETCAVFEVEQGVFSIRIDPALKGVIAYARIVLLHEMCHLATWPQHPRHQHGRPFQERMLQLAHDGAFKNLW